VLLRVNTVVRFIVSFLLCWMQHLIKICDFCVGRLMEKKCWNFVTF